MERVQRGWEWVRLCKSSRVAFNNLLFLGSFRRRGVCLADFTFSVYRYELVPIQPELTLPSPLSLPPPPPIGAESYPPSPPPLAGLERTRSFARPAQAAASGSGSGPPTLAPLELDETGLVDYFHAL